MKSDLERLIGCFHPGDEGLAAEFEEHMGAVYPERPHLLCHARVLDVSEATVAKRKTRFWGHVSGYDPALVWHL